jgi:uncharacterized membrane protein
MNKGLSILAGICLVFYTLGAVAQPPGQQKDPFRGKLIAPNVILDNRDELNLTKEQFTAIRQAVVAAQGEIAEHEWDLREAYQLVMADLDESPVDAARVLENVEKALLAENEVKKRQVALLIELRNLLTDEQFEYLQSVK